MSHLRARPRARPDESKLHAGVQGYMDMNVDMDMDMDMDISTRHLPLLTAHAAHSSLHRTTWLTARHTARPGRQLHRNTHSGERAHTCSRQNLHGSTFHTRICTPVAASAPHGTNISMGSVQRCNSGRKALLELHLRQHLHRTRGVRAALAGARCDRMGKEKGVGERKRGAGRTTGRYLGSAASILHTVYTLKP